MKVYLGVGLAVLAAGAVFVLNKPQAADVYGLPQAQVYARLAHAGAAGEGDHVFHLGAPKITGNGTDRIEWAGHATTCTLTLSAVDANSTRVAASCGQNGDDVPTSFQSGLLRDRVIETVDASLNGRPYDPDKAVQGITGSDWAADVVHHANAVEMQQWTAKQIGQAYKELPGRMEAAAQAQNSANGIHDSFAGSAPTQPAGSVPARGNPWGK